MCHGKLESEVLSLLSMVKEDLLGEGKISYIHIFYYYLTATTKKSSTDCSYVRTGSYGMGQDFFSIIYLFITLQPQRYPLSG